MKIFGKNKHSGNAKRRNSHILVAVAFIFTVAGLVGLSLYAGETATAATIGKIDLKPWKLTLPVKGGDGPKEITQPQLATYSDTWYHKVADGQEFYVDTRRATATTANSKNPRSELREMTSDGKNRASWKSTSGRHILLIRQKVTELTGRKHVVIGQIHDAEDDVTVFRLEGNQLWITNGNSTHGHSLGKVNLGQVITVGFDVSGGVVRYYYSPTGSTKPSLISYSQRKSFSGAYFKAGNYHQKGDSGLHGVSRVVIMGLGVTHNGTVPNIGSESAPPTPTPTPQPVPALSQAACNYMNLRWANNTCAKATTEKAAGTVVEAANLCEPGFTKYVYAVGSDFCTQ